VVQSGSDQACDFVQKEEVGRDEGVRVGNNTSVAAVAIGLWVSLDVVWRLRARESRRADLSCGQ
jgi:hypothetical protein